MGKRIKNKFLNATNSGKVVPGHLAGIRGRYFLPEVAGDLSEPGGFNRVSIAPKNTGAP